MCDFTNGIKLCTCNIEEIKFREPESFNRIKGKLVKIKNKKNENISSIYIWRLFRNINKEKEWAELGKYLMPSNDIGKGLNSEWIALNLNVENCFDFNYIPQEGDNLFIQKNEILGKYISFIFRNKEWKIEHYDPFNIITEHITDGILKSVK